MTEADVQLLSSSEALLRLGLQRDPDAWSALIDRHGTAILRAAGRVTTDAALREDICQETLLQIRAHARDFRPRGNSHEAELFARAWIMRIACCTALKMIRTRTRSTERENKVPPVAPPSSPAENAVAQEQAEQIRREVAALPEAHREAVSLRYFGECAYVEIAAILRISEDAAKKRVQRGLDLLRERLATCGVALSVSLLAGVLQQGSAAAADVAVASATAASSASAATAASAGSGASTVTSGVEAASDALEVLDLSRRAAWQALVNSSQTPALTGVLGGGLTMTAKTGVGIAAAALLALGIGGGMEIRASSQKAEQAAASAAEVTLQARALETKLEGSRNEIDALRRVVESRNSELTSLRDKVAEIDKRGVGGPMAMAGGMGGGGGRGVTTNRFFTRTDGDRLIALPNDLPPEQRQRFAEALAAAEGALPNRNTIQEIQLPDGKMMIHVQNGEGAGTGPFTIQVAPPGVPGAPNATATAAPDAPGPAAGNGAPPHPLGARASVNVGISAGNGAPPPVAAPAPQTARPLRVQLPPAVLPPAPPQQQPNVLPNSAPNAKGKAEGEF